MIIGIGFGSPLVAFLMLIITASISFLIYRAIRNSLTISSDRNISEQDFKEERRQFYRQQRDKAHKMIKEYDLTDEEIERRIDKESR